MRSALALLALCACNQVFGIKSTKQVDAAYFDAPPDAPFGCPATGSDAPPFSPSLHQVVVQSCTAVHFRGNLAVGLCYVGTDLSSGWVQENVVGAPGTVLAPAQGLPQTTQSTPINQWDEGRVAVDGQRVFFHHLFGNVTFTHEIVPATALPDGSWTTQAALPLPGYVDPILYAVYGGPTGDRLLTGDGTTFHEWASDGAGGFGLAGTHAPADSGFQNVSSIDVTADGLHAVAYAALTGNKQLAMYYLDRASVDRWFGAPRLLSGVPLVFDFDVTDDCGRVYFPGLGSLFYAQQQ